MTKLTKQEFVTILAEELDATVNGVRVTKKLAIQILEGVENAIERVLLDENASFSLGTLGQFKLSIKDEQIFRNPQTGGEVTKPRRYKVKFEPSKPLKEAVESTPVK